MPKKQSGSDTSKTAAKVLRTGKATPKQARELAGSVLSQDEKSKGKKGKGR